MVNIDVYIYVRIDVLHNYTYRKAHVEILRTKFLADSKCVFLPEGEAPRTSHQMGVPLDLTASKPHTFVPSTFPAATGKFSMLNLTIIYGFRALYGHI